MEWPAVNQHILWLPKNPVYRFLNMQRRLDYISFNDTAQENGLRKLSSKLGVKLVTCYPVI